eukprot:7887731-Alexandrium_andersonii.AAC.1
MADPERQRLYELKANPRSTSLTSRRSRRRRSSRPTLRCPTTNASRQPRRLLTVSYTHLRAHETSAHL